MADIFDLANAFLSIAPMTNKKLQKLCFYAKAFYLAIYSENLVDEDFEAWVHGPVCPDLYSKYKRYGFEDIPMIKLDKSTPEEFVSFANEIYDAYGHLTGDELETLTHREDPWKEAREGLKPWQASNNVISEGLMADYYRNQLECDD